MKALSFWKAVTLDKSNLLEEVFALLQDNGVEAFPHTLNISSAGSNLRVQFQTDPRYGEFVERASIREVLGLQLPVASLEDVLQGKIWAASHPERRTTKRKKDLLDIERLLESFPALKALVPNDILHLLR